MVGLAIARILVGPLGRPLVELLDRLLVGVLGGLLVELMGDLVVGVLVRLLGGGLGVGLLLVGLLWMGCWESC